MSKMQEAFELEFGLRDNGEKYWQESSAFFKSWCAFQKGYQAAIADVKVVGEVGSVQGQTAYVFATSDALFKVGDKLYKPEDV